MQLLINLISYVRKTLGKGDKEHANLPMAHMKILPNY